jgi:hypothetical protein
MSYINTVIAVLFLCLLASCQPSKQTTVVLPEKFSWFNSLDQKRFARFVELPFDQQWELYSIIFRKERYRPVYPLDDLIALHGEEIVPFLMQALKDEDNTYMVSAIISIFDKLRGFCTPLDKNTLLLIFNEKRERFAMSWQHEYLDRTIEHINEEYREDLCDNVREHTLRSLKK